MEKFFNTAGSINPKDHYNLDPLHRFDLEEIEFLIKQKKYFILHAPRQTGKTSSLLALQKHLNNSGEYNAVYANFEVGQSARNNVKSGIEALISHIAGRIEDEKIWSDILRTRNYHDALNYYLTKLAEASQKPLILLIDEIDALIGDTLISVLRQIRAGYDKRPANFPQTIVLCGVRDIKDYRIHRSDADIITGGSAFNIKAESLRLGNFSAAEIKELYLQHTKETSQKFSDDCFPLIWEFTKGQPWLVNALAHEVTFKMKENRDRSKIITKEMIEEAKNRLVVSRVTHLDQLSDKLQEDRVKRVILPMINNTDARSMPDDVDYCYDLGLIQKTPKGWQISNAIYREIIPREITASRQDDFLMRFDPDWVTKEDQLDTEVLISMFQQFWRENSEIWASNIAGYQEAAPHLVFQAYLQRVANGRGTILRKYGLGRGRTDLMLKWKSAKGFEQRIVIELKVMTSKDGYETIKQKALMQTAEYADKCKATESHILIFDRDEKLNWREKVFTDSGEHDNIKMKIWGM